MQHSDKPFDELALAAEAIQNIEGATNHRDLLLSWKSFLHHIDRVWNKARAHYSRSPKWGGWSGFYFRSREGDPLLIYLYQARNADEHGIPDLTKHVPGSLSINPLMPGGRLHIERLEMRAGKIVDLSLGTPAIVEIQPDKIELLPVTNRGKVYAPPASHLGAAVNCHDIPHIAKLGYQYYSNFLQAAETFFVKNPS